MKLIPNDQIKIHFKDGSTIIAIVTNVEDDQNIVAKALNKNERYNEGDTIFVNESEDKIEKISMKKQAKVVHKSDGWHTESEKGKNLGGPYKTKDEALKRLRQVEYFKHKGMITAKRFNWAFDKHKPQYKYNEDTNIIEKEEENVTKIAMKKKSSTVVNSCPECESTDIHRCDDCHEDIYHCNVCGWEWDQGTREDYYGKNAKKTASQDQPSTVSVTKVFSDWESDDLCRKILKSDLPDDEKKQKLMERITYILENDSVYDALWNDGANNEILDKSDIVHNTDSYEPVQIDQNEIDTKIQEYNEDRELWNEEEGMFEEPKTGIKKEAMDYGPKQAIEEANQYFADTLQGKVVPDQDDIMDVAADLLSDVLGLNYEAAMKRLEEYQGGEMLDEVDYDEEDLEDGSNEPWTDPAGGTHEGREPNLKQYEMKKKEFYGNHKYPRSNRGIEQDSEIEDRDDDNTNKGYCDNCGQKLEDGYCPDCKNYYEDKLKKTRSMKLKKISHKLAPETANEVDSTFNDVKRLMQEYDQTDDYNKLLEIKGILTSLLRVVEAEAKECMDNKGKE